MPVTKIKNVLSNQTLIVSCRLAGDALNGYKVGVQDVASKDSCLGVLRRGTIGPCGCALVSLELPDESDSIWTRGYSGARRGRASYRFRFIEVGEFTYPVYDLFIEDSCDDRHGYVEIIVFE